MSLALKRVETPRFSLMNLTTVFLGVIAAMMEGCHHLPEHKAQNHLPQAQFATRAAFVASLEAGRPQKIVAYGTSLTANGTWVARLQDVLNAKFPHLAEVVNAGQAAMWSKWGIENLNSRVISRHPDVVFIEFAMNDAFLDYQTSVAAARDNLEKMISLIREAYPKCEIILMVMNRPTGVHLEERPRIADYEQMYRETALGHSLRLIDFSADWQTVLRQGEVVWRELVPDGIHPNDRGSEVVIMPHMLKSLGLDLNIAAGKQANLTDALKNLGSFSPRRACLQKDCHPERSEGSTCPNQPPPPQPWILRFAQNDRFRAWIDFENTP